MRTPLRLGRRVVGVSVVGLLSGAAACSEDAKTPADTSVAETTVAETTVAETTAETSDTTEAETEVVSYEKPAYFPDQANADQVLELAGVADPVRVIYDNRGIPHIYGKNTHDVVFAQGYVTARDRMFQMHTLRSAAKGRLAEFGGAKSLSGDIYLRMLKLGSVAKDMAAYTKANDPDLEAALEAYTDGVNAYLKNMREGREVKALETNIFGADLVYDWTPEDTMAIARLQTWDLGFGGVVDELDLYDSVSALLEAFPAGSKLAGVALDVANFEPPVEAATNPPEAGAKQVPEWSLASYFDRARTGKSLSKSQRERMRKEQRDLDTIPHHAFRGNGGEEWGSNNWVVSGAHTQSGRPIVSNDTHLSLRNPAVFYQVHVSNTLAGGNLDAQGVNFAGAPGIVLGHNAHAAWGATVFYDDVTDMYTETLDADKKHAKFKGEWVALGERKETFHYALPGGATACVDAAPGYVKSAMAYTESLDDKGICTLEVTVLDVPNHGPVVPWSLEENADHTWSAVSWKWTGFEATDDLGAIWRLNTVTNYEDFKAALNRFGVGAQNWIFGGSDGDIGWYPSHLLPIRACAAGTDTKYPPFFPMPGEDGECEWTGFVPRADLPQAHNPARGYIFTANADPIGVSFDGDPFNDLPYYLGYAWDIGFRAARVEERLKTAFTGDAKLTRADMSAIQGDYQSSLGRAMVPTILAALKKVKDGDATEAASLLTAEVEQAATLLTKWQELGFPAESGVGAAADSDEAKASAATAIFNTFIPLLLPNLFEESAHLTDLGDSMTGRLLVRLFQKPETMHSYDAVGNKSPLWDDVRTADVFETRETIILKTLGQAMAFLADPTRVGVAASGGFGTTDVTAWRWGLIHTIKFASNVAPVFNVPSPALMPDGYPRHGDNFNVDANSIGLGDTNFMYSHGPAIRNVFELTDVVTFDGVVAGGQSENPTLPHYSDETDHWAKNEAPPEYFTTAAVLGAREKTVDFITKK